ncbi:MAG TPA: aminotransferase class III-fold pyridoxal phosphate-dependent enzyme [Sulfurimonas sp.]|nr:aminotransferase class III-fold pyridoxal phosphate-dependent enzyme [Sulfurimonas sp.]HIM74996.1 aminotransferase class III-fold pyridoxal phosphate-dependent enzyme [Campylobacterales bacterium]
MMNTQELDKKYVLQTYGRGDVEFVSGDNATLTDTGGKQYIDFTSGIGVVSVGHANARVNAAICQQIGKITHTSNLYNIAPQAKAAEAIVNASGYDMACFFGNSGAEANEGAIKIVRKHGERDGEIKRYKIITLKHSFHGRTITTVKATGQEAMHNYFGPFPDGFVYAEDIQAIEALLDDHTAAVMIELIQGEGGVEPQDKKQVQALEKLLKSKHIPLIVDEVQTGGYRTGEFTASQVYGITPEIITLAKGIGGGVPVGVVMTSLKNVLSPGDHGSTFGGNYLSTTAVCSVIEILNELKVSGELDKTSAYFNEVLDNFYETNKKLFTQKVGIGMMCGLRVIDAETLGSIMSNAKENGVMVLRAGRNTLRFLPPLTITKEEINEGFKALAAAVSSL